MTQRKKGGLLTLFALLLGLNVGYAQGLLDLSVGSSQQDRFFTNIAYRLQLSSRLRIGAELQLASTQYRFIDAKPITEGYASTLSLPISWQLYQNERIDLHFFFRPGVRFQGIIDPDDNDVRDEVLNSTAILLDPGLMVSIKATDRLRFQSGVSFPTLFQVQPSALFENNSTAIHANVAYQVSKRSALFAKTLMGPAVGASGDSQKFVWSAQAGLRLSLGTPGKGNVLLMEPSY
ncbi:hypothetical protein [Haliscomenobacter hydrossis]|uniref:Outer membrane protein beta-barrel domain-containing protein n=1 Tax=Haliscomenobacter hydrossis (strain ATCC 27775 / DSM 1100 / LMG 10767 / O) TaxID=760192 RepID=F4KWC8_HALH1|nr:hypothetical protein [Haliscomenobacter hydrossis]AEE50278.1 hypothetical protein Halhy_2403 [Haliscomenobacter hydrossis DSM 1100]